MWKLKTVADNILVESDFEIDKEKKSTKQNQNNLLVENYFEIHEKKSKKKNTKLKNTEQDKERRQ